MIFLVSNLKHMKGQWLVLTFCWLLPLFVKINAATSEANMKNYSQNIRKSNFNNH